jgi:osmotically-inducible protein OsmY
MRNRNHLHGAVVLAVLGVLASGPRAVAGDDAEIQEAIEARIEKKGLEQETRVRVDVRDGEVTLHGVATNLPASREAEQQARKEAKVVHNQIKVVIEEPVKDAEIIDGIRKAILGYPDYDVFDHVEFGVSDGAVLLRGSVLHPWKRRSIESRVARVPGVRTLQNDINVQSLSPYDSKLRNALARRIYGDARFAHYRHQAHPPIRILVDHGHVTLAGWVNSPVEKAMLGSIARSTLSFTVKNELRVDGEVPAEDRKEEPSES